MGNPVVHFEVVGRNLEALNSFYSELFDWKLNAVPNIPYATVDTGSDEGIAGGIGSSDDPADPGVTFYVQVPDLQAALDKAEGLGGKTVHAPMDVIPGQVSIASFQDPEGNVIGLVKG